MTVAPKPENFDRLTAVWDNPEAFALERAAYFAQIARERGEFVDVTEPRRRVERE